MEDEDKEAREKSVTRNVSFRPSILRRMSSFISLKEYGQFSYFVREACIEKLERLENLPKDQEDSSRFE